MTAQKKVAQQQIEKNGSFSSCCGRQEQKTPPSATDDNQKHEMEQTLCIDSPESSMGIYFDFEDDMEKKQNTKYRFPINEKPQCWIFTFHPQTEYAYNFAELYGLYHQTRIEMTRLFGTEWNYQHKSRLHACVQQYNLEKLDLRDETPMDSEHFRKVHDAD